LFKEDYSEKEKEIIITLILENEVKNIGFFYIRRC